MTDNQREWHLTSPDHFTCGTIGEPGSRVFFLQARSADTRVDVKCEKQQAMALADHLLRLLGDLPDPAGGPDRTSVIPTPPDDPGPLEFVVGSISIGVDRKRDRVVAMLEELVVDPDDPAVLQVSPAKLIVHLTREQVWGLANQVDLLVAASRPRCRLCEMPMDPLGHVCPRLN